MAPDVLGLLSLPVVVLVPILRLLSLARELAIGALESGFRVRFSLITIRTPKIVVASLYYAP